MTKKSAFKIVVQTVNEISKTAKEREIVHQYTDDEELNGREISINGKRLIHFGSCSYLGLETDERLKQSAVDAVMKYGTQFSSSRSYVSCANYLELENLLEDIFGTNVLVSPNTSMGHGAVLPVVVGCNDIVIFDQQAHYSMQEVISRLIDNGTHTSIVRHSRIDELISKVEKFKSRYDKIWYVIDGVYSMYGDFAPLDKLYDYMKKDKQFHLYVDDAHGMGWAGKNGSGYALSKIKMHPQAIVATSLAKGFGSCGGVFLFDDVKLRDQVKYAGGALLHSGPQQPATVGASIASAKIHLSDEIYDLQKSLKKRIQFCNQVLKKYNLPVVSNSEGPIFFIGLGLTRMGYNMVRRMKDSGFYVNLGIFPAVPETRTGIRFTITNHLKFEDIENLARTIAEHLPEALKEEGRTMKDIYRAFRSFLTTEKKPILISENVRLDSDFKVRTYDTIQKLDEKEWNSGIGKEGLLDYQNMSLLERSFRNNISKENNWKFNYYQVLNAENTPVVSTFFTTVIAKDDMLSSAAASKAIEERRINDPYFLTSTNFLMGSLITEGEHLYINKKDPNWKKALSKLIDVVWEEQDKQKASILMLRDFLSDDSDIKEFFTDNGFVKVELPENNVIINEPNLSADVFFEEKLNKKQRLELRKHILANEGKFEVSVDSYKEEELEEFYELYKNVRANSLQLNTFALPFKFFQQMHLSEQWEIIKIEHNNKLASVVFCFKANGNYYPTIIGIDYSLSKNLNIYKQSLYQVVKRGLELKANKIYLGLSASITKRKFGASNIKIVAYVQRKDTYSSEYIRNMSLKMAQ